MEKDLETQVNEITRLVISTKADATPKQVLDLACELVFLANRCWEVGEEAKTLELEYKNARSWIVKDNSLRTDEKGKPWSMAKSEAEADDEMKNELASYKMMETVYNRLKLLLETSWAVLWAAKFYIESLNRNMWAEKDFSNIQ